MVLFQVLSEDGGFYSAVVVEYSPYLNSSLDAEVNIINNVKNYANIIKVAATGRNKVGLRAKNSFESHSHAKLLTVRLI